MTTETITTITVVDDNAINVNIDNTDVTVVPASVPPVIVVPASVGLPGAPGAPGAGASPEEIAAAVQTAVDGALGDYSTTDEVQAFIAAAIEALPTDAITTTAQVEAIANAIVAAALAAFTPPTSIPQDILDKLYSVAPSARSQGMLPFVSSTTGSIVRIGTKIYVVQGYLGEMVPAGYTGPNLADLGITDNHLGAVQVFDTVTDTWLNPVYFPASAETGNVPIGWMGGAAVEVGGVIYATVGMWDTNAIDDASGILLNRAMFSFDPATGVIERKADSTTAGDSRIGWSFGGKFYLTGGRDYDQAEDPSVYGDNERNRLVEAYDPATDTWTRMGNLHPVGIDYGFAVVIGGLVYVFGVAANTSWPYTYSFCSYDPTTDTWTELAVPSRSIGSPEACVVDGKVWIAAGGAMDADYNLYTDTPANRVFQVYDPATNTWSDGSSTDYEVPAPYTFVPEWSAYRYASGGAVSLGDGTVYFIGSGPVLKLHPDHTTWETVAPPLGRFHWLDDPFASIALSMFDLGDVSVNTRIYKGDGFLWYDSTLQSWRMLDFNEMNSLTGEDLNRGLFLQVGLQGSQSLYPQWKAVPKGVEDYFGGYSNEVLATREEGVVLPVPLQPDTVLGRIPSSGFGSDYTGVTALTMTQLLAMLGINGTLDVDKPVSTAQAAADALRVAKAGDTMTGALTLAGNATSALHAVTLQQMQAAINGLINGAPGSLDTFIEAYNRFVADESIVTALQGTVAGKVALSTITAANQIVVGTANATAGVLDVPTSTVVGRTAAGVLAALSMTTLKSLLGIAVGDVSGLGTAATHADTDYEHSANKGAASGYASLDTGSRVVQSPKLHRTDHLAGGADALGGQGTTAAMNAIDPSTAPTGFKFTVTDDAYGRAVFEVVGGAWVRIAGLPQTAILKYSGSAYPTRPTGAVMAIFEGPVDPGASALDNDLWVSTA